jgi:uncharacterized NAD(P)/FAD-binding protein YdhS
LAADGQRPVDIALIDRDSRHGLGQAYATTYPGHLLNSPADTMSAVAGDPGQLLRWAGANAIARSGVRPPGHRRLNGRPRFRCPLPADGDGAVASAPAPARPITNG